MYRRVLCAISFFKKTWQLIKVEHWGIAAIALEKAEIKFPLPIDISGKKILIVDDVVDTGDTFIVTMDYVKGKNPLEVKSSVLHYKTCSTFVPDYWAEKQDEWKWVIYPWAVYEDMTGFIERVLIKPMTHEEIRKALKSNFDIKISKKDLVEMLDDMHAAGKIQKIKKRTLMKKFIYFQNKDSFKELESPQTFPLISFLFKCSISWAISYAVEPSKNKFFFCVSPLLSLF